MDGRIYCIYAINQEVIGHDQHVGVFQFCNRHCGLYLCFIWYQADTVAAGWTVREDKWKCSLVFV